MRLAGAGLRRGEIVDAVGCSFGQAQKIVRERNARVRANRALWFDTGDLHPPAQAVRTQPRGTYT